MDKRPDEDYWSASREKRRKFSKQYLDGVHEALAKYSLKRFVLGRMFFLRCDRGGIPKGTYCMVSSTWPNTKVRWMPWGNNKNSYGRRAIRTSTMSFELDRCLVPADKKNGGKDDY